MMFSAHGLEIVVKLLGVLSTLAILSVVYRENPVYRFFEHLFIGVATGFGVFVVWRDALSQGWWQPISHGSWYWILAPLVAMLFYTVYFPKYAWLSRFLICIMFGLGAGQAFRGFATQVFPQVASSFLPILPLHGGVLVAGAAEHRLPGHADLGDGLLLLQLPPRA